MKPYILILSATSDEVCGIIDNIENPTTCYIGFKKVISGIISNSSIKVLVTGPSILNTACALTAVIEKEKPLMIIQTGCGGVFKNHALKTCKIGDICIATKEIFAEFGIESDDKNIFIKNPPFYLHKNFKHIFQIDTNLANHAESILKKRFKDNNIKKGTFLTVSTITATDKRADILFKTFDAPIMENMEGAASAYISLLYDIPFLEVRSASNIVGKRDKSKWKLKEAFEKCSAAVLEFINNSSVISRYYSKSRR
jgi:futalosine hydrolase